MKITIVEKMILLSMAAILGLISIAWFGQNRMNTVFEKANFANINSIPAIVMLGKATESFGQMRARIYRHTLNTEQTEKVKMDALIKDAQNKVTSSLKDYVSTLVDDKDKQLLAEDIATFNDYIKAIDIALDLSRQNKTEQSLNELTKCFVLAEKVSVAFRTHTDYNIDMAKK